MLVLNLMVLTLGYKLVFPTALYESNYTDLDLEPHWLAQSFLGLAMVG